MKRTLTKMLACQVCNSKCNTRTNVFSFSCFLSFNSQCTSPPTDGRLYKSKGCWSRSAPRLSRVGPPLCLNPPNRSPASRKPLTHTTLSDHGRTGTTLTRVVGFSWCSKCARTGNSWRAAHVVVSARSPPAGQHPAAEPPSLCRYLNKHQPGVSSTALSV